MSGRWPSIPRPETGHAPDDPFYRRAETYLDGMLKLNPHAATYLGYHRYDGLMDDYGPEGIAGRLAFFRQAAADFAAFRPETLSTGAAVDLDLVRTDTDSALFHLTDLRSHESDPQIYNDILGYGTLYLTILEPGAPEWPDRLEALLGRLRALPRFLRDARQNLKSPARVVTSFIAEQNPGNIAFVETALPPLFSPYPALDADLRRELPAALDALRDYQRFLETELTARSTGDWRLGPGLWSRKLRLTLQSDLEPEEIQRRAWKHLHRGRAAMMKLAEPMHARLFPGHRHPEGGDDLINALVGEVLEEVSRRHSEPDRVLDDCRRWVEKCKAFIRSKDLITLPPESDNFVVERTPAFLDGMAVAFFNPPPAFEPHLKKSFWVSSIPRDGVASYLREYNDYGLQCLAIHEAFPGHYVQFYHALNSPIASIYKKVFPSSTFAEGWAVLCEEQVFEQGYGEGEPEALLVHLKMALRAPLNAILDARLHTEPMPDDEADRWALDLMRRYGFQEEAEAVRKLRRAKVSSTQLSTYFVGYLDLLDLMRDYRAQEGVAFQLKSFNEALLSLGTIPPRAVRRLLLG
ncbi:MAG: DUF885 domain-containing protein [Candidatus Polarisedimenticolia bacterium]